MITTNNIKFKGRHFNLAGRLFFPENFSEQIQQPAIVITHPTSADMNQTSSIYATKLAENGFLALAFDASYQGQSEGEPRYIEDPANRTTDIMYAIDYLNTLPFVDNSRIGAMGICAGGGYTINAAKTDKRIKAIGTVSAASAGGAYRESFGPDDALIATLEQIAKQRTAEATGSEPLITQWIPNNQSERIQMQLNDIDVIEAVDYYRTPRGQDSFSPNKVLFTSFGLLLNYDPVNLVEKLLNQPLEMVVGDRPGSFGSYRFAYEIYNKAASKNKHLTVLPGVSHYDLYDQPKAVNAAIEQLVPFFKSNL
ncbi:prolyl oligopeptidase family protein [Weissella oryzae SG25]|uniref:Prolyl oligopeptidase family protein n=1 Tax=Weissella oryzae (strain DSM 25784 / JCM 18191 / LMG 30913 / SG25) TaxID=1329250 RepID=A0A069D347_WEIOS|nr:alpha/beta hydrolase [Weissella oryzae]GAK31791.1 prolyl oligopeptidase family protein [Weissella oryzae SG25]